MYFAPQAYNFAPQQQYGYNPYGGYSPYGFNAGRYQIVPDQFRFGNASPYLPNFFAGDIRLGTTPTQLLGTRPVSFPPENSIGNTVNVYSGQQIPGDDYNTTYNLSYASNAYVQGGQGKDYFRIVSNYGYGNNNTIEDQGGADEVFLGSYVTGNTVKFNGNNGPDVAVFEGREAEHTLAPISGGFLVTNNVTGAKNTILTNNTDFLNIFYEIPEGTPAAPPAINQPQLPAYAYNPYQSYQQPVSYQQSYGFSNGYQAPAYGFYGAAQPFSLYF
ncbi:MAG: hypothetical protein KC476_03115 [Cyanobacteria bacterium HKST-UBA06]|nr:hypothetical protein [Cyanobacteria bacterium HKST-UBA06]